MRILQPSHALIRIPVWVIPALIAAASAGASSGGGNPGTSPNRISVLYPQDASASVMIQGVAPAVQPYWVFFRDHGTERLDGATMASLAEKIIPEAWERRARGDHAALPDDKDLPLWEPYVQQVVQHGHLRHRVHWLNAVSMDLTPQAVAEVAALPCVEGVRPVARGRIVGLGPRFDRDGKPLEVTEPRPQVPVPQGAYPYGPSYGQLQEINVPAVHALGYTGNRVRLMMIDDGFRKDHNAFRHAKIVGEWDFVQGDGDTQNQQGDDPEQDYHGTGTWSVLGGYDPGHIVGPAYGASFVLAKTENISSETEQEEDNYVDALQWGDSLGVIATSASLIYTCFDDGFCWQYYQYDGHTAPISEAIEIAADRGICCCNAMGNYGPGAGSLGEPADADSLISVGAVDSLNVLASFSSRGPTGDGRTKPEVDARGVDTWWADASQQYTYGFASGTSLSTPLVGGCVGLLLEAHPEWSPMQVRAALMNTADKHSHPDNNYGWGRVNLLAALNYTPVVFPVPYSLVAPSDSSTVTNLTPTFTWNRTHTPGLLTPVTYTVWITDPTPGGAQYQVPAGTDTTLTLSFPLNVSKAYQWEVKADNSSGHRRTSRETRTFFTPFVDGVPASGRAATLADISVGPNPFTDRVSFQARFAGGAGSAASMQWSVYDPTGRMIASNSVSSRQGTLAGSWDGRDLNGRAAPAGIYYLEARVGAQVARHVLVHLAPGQAH